MKDKQISDKTFCEKLIEKSSAIDKKITALMCTIPSREDVCLKAIDSIYDQVDEVWITFNGYEKLPDWARFKVPRVTPFLDETNQYTDCAKWQHVPKNGYVFIIDDDILYPHDYVSKMISKIEQYKRKAVVTVHGSFFKLPFVGFKESKRSFHFMLERPEDVRVPMIGTGTLAFHTDTIRPKFKDFPDSSRSDIWFSALCLKRQIPMMCIERDAGWLKILPTSKDTIWNRMMLDKGFMDQNSEYVRDLIIPHIKGDIVCL